MNFQALLCTLAVSQHTVEVEETGAHLIRQTQQRRTSLPGHSRCSDRTTPPRPVDSLVNSRETKNTRPSKLVNFFSRSRMNCVK